MNKKRKIVAKKLTPPQTPPPRGGAGKESLKLSVISFLLATIPLPLFAAGLTDLIDAASGLIIGILIPIAFSLCIFYFLWGVTKYIGSGAKSDKAAEEGRRVMTWGIIGLFVAFSIWGIIELIKNELGLPDIQNVDTSLHV